MVDTMAMPTPGDTPGVRPAALKSTGITMDRPAPTSAKPTQHGFSDGFKTVEGLRKELIDGVIFSPRDITPEKLRESASKCTESSPISERLFDPQYYATLSAQDPLSRTGYLQEEYSCYFAPRRYDQLLRESEVIEDVSK